MRTILLGSVVFTAAALGRRRGKPLRDCGSGTDERECLTRGGRPICGDCLGREHERWCNGHLPHDQSGRRPRVWCSDSRQPRCGRSEPLRRTTPTGLADSPARPQSGNRGGVDRQVALGHQVVVGTFRRRGSIVWFADARARQRRTRQPRVGIHRDQRRSEGRRPLAGSSGGVERRRRSRSNGPSQSPARIWRSRANGRRRSRTIVEAVLRSSRRCHQHPSTCGRRVLLLQDRHCCRQ